MQIIIQKKYFEILKYFLEIYSKEEFMKHHDDLIIKIINLIQKDYFYEKEDFLMIMDLIIKMNLKGEYSKFINEIIYLIPKKEFIIKRNDLFDIIQYFEKILRFVKEYDKEYDILGYNLISIISEKHVRNIFNYLDIIKYLLNSFGEKKKNNLYEKLSSKIIPVIIQDFF